MVLLQLGKVGKYYADAGPDAEYDSQSYYFDSGFNELANRKLPTTREEYEEEMDVYADSYAEDLNSAIGRILETDTTIVIPSTSYMYPEFRLDRENLRIYETKYNEFAGKLLTLPNYQCKKTNRKQLRDELESMRVKYEAYKMRMQAANPGDTRKI